MIEVQQLIRAFGRVRGVDDLSFTVPDGSVTGFVGPNGAGKSATLRCLTGLDTPTAGRATFGGVVYRRLHHPARVVGALLDPSWVHPGRTARAHLRWVSRAAGIPVARCAEVLELTGLAQVGRHRVSSFSLGMRQRLALATALLGDPHYLVLDEPLNGLDPDGIHWMRALLRRYADDGRTVLVSSHLLAELELVADRIVLIGRGRLVAEHTMPDLLAQARGTRVRLRMEGDSLPLVRALTGDGWQVSRDGDTHLLSGPGTSDDVGRLCARHRVVVLELSTDRPRLEEAVLHATQDRREYLSGGAA
ncbi:MAG: ATP-binding cassette domain-containing protein [Dermatophilaceae bacterium]